MVQGQECAVINDPVKKTIDRGTLIERYRETITDAIRLSDPEQRESAQQALQMLSYLAAMGVLGLQFHGIIDDLMPTELRQS